DMTRPAPRRNGVSIRGFLHPPLEFYLEPVLLPLHQNNKAVGAEGQLALAPFGGLREADFSVTFEGDLQTIGRQIVETHKAFVTVAAAERQQRLVHLEKF